MTFECKLYRPENAFNGEKDFGDGESEVVEDAEDADDEEDDKVDGAGQLIDGTVDWVDC